MYKELRKQLHSMDWFKEKLQEDPRCNGNIYGFVQIFPEINPLIYLIRRYLAKPGSHGTWTCEPQGTGLAARPLLASALVSLSNMVPLEKLSLMIWRKTYRCDLVNWPQEHQGHCQWISISDSQMYNKKSSSKCDIPLGWSDTPHIAWLRQRSMVGDKAYRRTNDDLSRVPESET